MTHIFSKKISSVSRVKIFFLLLAIAVAQIVASQNISDGGSVILKKGKTTLPLLFSTITAQTGYRFSYDPTIIPNTTDILVLKSQRLSINEALNSYLPQSLKYIISGKYIVIQLAKKKAVPPPFVEKKSKFNTPIYKPDSLEKTSKKADTSPNLEAVAVQNSDTKEKLNVEKSLVVTPKSASSTTAVNDSKKVPTEVIQNDSTNFLGTISKNISFFKKPFEKLDTSSSFKKSISFSVDLLFNSHLSELILHAHYKALYTGLGIGYDYFGSYFGGVVIGTVIVFKSKISLGTNLTAYSLIAGKSNDLHVKGLCFQLTPYIGYSFWENRLMVYAGPNLGYISSRYNYGGETFDLGSVFKINGSLGIRYNLQQK